MCTQMFSQLNSKGPNSARASVYQNLCAGRQLHMFNQCLISTTGGQWRCCSLGETDVIWHSRNGVLRCNRILCESSCTFFYYRSLSVHTVAYANVFYIFTHLYDGTGQIKSRR